MKKLILYLLLAILSIRANAQTSLETAVFGELNAYRTKNGLCTLNVNKDLSSLAGYHCRYLVTLNEMGQVDSSHDERIDVPNWRELTYDQREAEFSKSDENNHFSGEVQLRSLSFLPGTSEKDIAKNIIQKFHDSPKHREIIRNEYDADYDLPIVGISVIKNPKKVAGYDVYTVVIDLGMKFNYYQK